MSGSVADSPSAANCAPMLPENWRNNWALP